MSYVPVNPVYRKTSKKKRKLVWGSGPNKGKPVPKGKPLSQPAVKQVTNIANRQINKNLESKYFNTKVVKDEVCNAAWNLSSSTGDVSEVAVWGFTTGYNRQSNPNDNEIIRYGQSTVDASDISMTSLNLNRVFVGDEAETKLRAFSVVGQKIKTSYNEVDWMFDYVAQNVTSDPTRGLAYRLRVIRVVPNVLKGSYQQIDPQNDLFLDQYNQEFGIQTGVDTSSPKFTKQQFHMAKVNKRLYSVKCDKFLTIRPSSTYNTQAEDTTGPPYQVTNLSSTGLLTWKTQHNIGKDLFYPTAATSDSTGSQYPESGFRPEYVLIHAIALGDDAVDPSDRVTPLGMSISARPVSTFKDA